MKKVYIITDDDDYENIHAFQNRRNAIQYAYKRCEAFGAWLTVQTWNASTKQWQHKPLLDVVGDNDPIDYLNALNDEAVNDVFYDYYFLAEVDIEDTNHNERG